MTVEVRAERLRVLLDPACDHDDATLDGVGAADVALALGCVEATRNAYTAAWDALAAVLAALDTYGTTEPAVAIERAHNSDSAAFVHLTLAAMTIGWHDPYDTRQGGG